MQGAYPQGSFKGQPRKEMVRKGNAGCHDRDEEGEKHNVEAAARCAKRRVPPSQKASPPCQIEGKMERHRARKQCCKAFVERIAGMPRAHETSEDRDEGKVEQKTEAHGIDRWLNGEIQENLGKR